MSLFLRWRGQARPKESAAKKADNKKPWTRDEIWPTVQRGRIVRESTSPRSGHSSPRAGSTTRSRARDAKHHQRRLLSKNPTSIIQPRGRSVKTFVDVVVNWNLADF